MWNRRRVVYYAILLLLILGELLGERNYIIIIFPEYDSNKLLIFLKKKKNKEEVQESVTCHINIIGLHNKCGKIVHRPCSSCISSIQGIDKDSICYNLAK